MRPACVKRKSNVPSAPRDRSTTEQWLGRSSATISDSLGPMRFIFPVNVEPIPIGPADVFSTVRQSGFQAGSLRHRGFDGG
jgi:hypothetical protein